MGQLSLLLLPADPEFVLTIILVVVAIVAYFIIQLSVRYLECIVLWGYAVPPALQIHYNSFTGYLLIAFVGVLLFAYYPFKIARYLVKHSSNGTGYKHGSEVLQVNHNFGRKIHNIEYLFHTLTCKKSMI